MKVKIKKLYTDAILPTKAHSTDAGWDLYAHSKTSDKLNVVYGTGLAFEIPQGYVGLLFPRSSNAKTDLLLSNSVGVVDSGYRGEVLFKFKGSLRCHDDFMVGEYGNPRTYEIGDRIGQMIIIPYPDVEFVEVDELSDSDRGTGGYGSSGK